MNDHSSSTRSWRSSGSRDRARSTVSAQRRFEDVPGLAELVGGLRLHLRVVGIAARELRLDQGRDVDAVDHDVLELAVDLDVGQLDPTHPYVADADVSHPRAREVDPAETCLAQARVLERRVREVVQLVAHDGHAKSACGRIASGTVAGSSLWRTPNHATPP